jgi:nucleoside-diphosphate-sugar epimerase
MRIAVTGAAGMLGSHLIARLLDDGHDVVGVDIRPPANPGGVVYFPGDVRDRTAMLRAFAGADAVVHCAAALPSYPAEQIKSVTVEGSRMVLTAARDAGVARTVHVSSTAVYGLPEVVPTTEDYPPSPVDTYGRAKTQAESIATQLRDQGMCLTILRPKTFLGPGRMGLFSMLFEWAEDGRNFPVLGRGDVRIQMLGVDDLVAAVCAVLNAPDGIANDTYNIGAAEFGTLREDFQAVLDTAGHGKRVVSLPARPALAALAGLRRCGLSPVYDRLLHKLMADSFVSVDKAKRQLGFEPALSNRDAILQTYQWWREHGRHQQSSGGGRTSGDRWQQGVLRAAKIIF